MKAELTIKDEIISKLSPDALYMCIVTSTVQTGEEWIDDIIESGEDGEDGDMDLLVEVQADGNGWWVEV